MKTGNGKYKGGRPPRMEMIRHGEFRVRGESISGVEIVEMGPQRVVVRWSGKTYVAGHTDLDGYPYAWLKPIPKTPEEAAKPWAEQYGRDALAIYDAGNRKALFDYVTALARSAQSANAVFRKFCAGGAAAPVIPTQVIPTQVIPVHGAANSPVGNLDLDGAFEFSDYLGSLGRLADRQTVVDWITTWWETETPQGSPGDSLAAEIREWIANGRKGR